MDSLGTWVAPWKQAGILLLACWSPLQALEHLPGAKDSVQWHLNMTLSLGGRAGCTAPSSVLRGHPALPQVAEAMSNSPPSCLYRRGSPLLIGVRSKYKLSTEQIPILYRTRKCFEKDLDRAMGLSGAGRPPRRQAVFTLLGPACPQLQVGEVFLQLRLGSIFLQKLFIMDIFKYTHKSRERHAAPLCKGVRARG